MSSQGFLPLAPEPPAGGPLTMSSREIAELLAEDGDVRHDNIKRTIDTLANRGAISRPQFEDRPFLDAQGKSRTEKVYLVGNRDSYVVVAQLSPQFTARLVDRWQELEAQVARPIDAMQVLNDPAAMRGLLLSYTEKVLALESENKALGEKGAALDRIAAADGSLCITDAVTRTAPRPRFGSLLRASLSLRARRWHSDNRRLPHQPSSVAHQPRWRSTYALENQRGGKSANGGQREAPLVTPT